MIIYSDNKKIKEKIKFAITTPLIAKNFAPIIFNIIPTIDVTTFNGKRVNTFFLPLKSMNMPGQQNLFHLTKSSMEANRILLHIVDL